MTKLGVVGVNILVSKKIVVCGTLGRRRGLGNDGEGKECLLHKGGILRSVDAREF